MDKTTWRREVEANFLVLSHSPRERLVWTTIILMAVVVRLDNDLSTHTRATIDQFASALPACLGRSGRIGRNRTRWAGCVEVELLHPRLLKGLRLLAQFGIDVDEVGNDERIALIHWHGVIDHRGHPSRAVMMRHLRGQWPGYRRVHGADIYEDGTVKANLEQLAGYSTKLVFRYSRAWDGRRTEFLGTYEAEWQQWMTTFLTKVGWSNLIVSSTKSQSSECTPEEAISQGNCASPGRLQLMGLRQDEGQPSPRVTMDGNHQEMLDEIMGQMMHSAPPPSPTTPPRHRWNTTLPVPGYADSLTKPLQREFQVGGGRGFSGKADPFS
jgi:hypothetical protein